MILETMLIVATMGTASLPLPNACQPAYCEEWSEEPGVGLTCYDTDTFFPLGHYGFSFGPDYGDLQATVEY